MMHKNNIENNELVPVAMNIILNAGEARDSALKAIDLAKDKKFDESDAKMKDADNAMLKAHQSQTQVIQNEMSGNGYDPTILFNHAQDTIMTVMSEIRMAKKMIEMYKVFYGVDKAETK